MGDVILLAEIGADDGGVGTPSFLGVEPVRLPLIPRNYRFYDLFEKSAHNLVAAGEQLLDLMEHYELSLIHISEPTRPY